MCPFSAAMKKGVAPFVLPWSWLAPDSTRNRTTSRCPFWAAMNRGVAPLSFRPWFWLAPASSSRSTHSRFPFEAAAHNGIVASASSKLGFRGWFRCCSSSLSLFWRHATIISRSWSISGGRNSILTSCTTPGAKVWSSSSGQLSWRSRSRNRGKPICCAKRCFNAFTEASANTSFSKTAIDSPVTAETTSTCGADIKKSYKYLTDSPSKVKHLEKNGCLRIWHLQNIGQPCIKIQAPACRHLVEMSMLLGQVALLTT